MTDKCRQCGATGGTHACDAKDIIIIKMRKQIEELTEHLRLARTMNRPFTQFSDGNKS
jgi:ABC-type Na+ transport system ATPase subunit NatA